MRGLIVGLALVLVGCGTISITFEEDTTHSDAYAPGPYAVGVKANFVKDFTRPFDAWGKRYKSDAYRELLERLEASGEPSTTVTNIYYPSPSSDGRVDRRNDIHPSTLWAPTEGERLTRSDLTMGNPSLAGMRRFIPWQLTEFQSFKDAPLANGTYPIVVMLHGLGGGLSTWNIAAEYLASHGYIVVTLAYISDSSDTPVFQDPNSFFAKTVSNEELQAAYSIRVEEPPVFTNFFKFLYGLEGDIKGPGDIPSPDQLTAREGGGIEAAQMMASLFEQRTEDLGAVITEMKILGTPEADCREVLEKNGITKGLCGFFAGAIDGDNIGVMGHSLGSITAQSALTFLPDVDTAIAFNNGLPKRWEPYGGLPDNGTSVLPDGVPKDIMLLIGSDDFFVHMVFREIHLDWFERAGGDINENYPLAIEQVWPSASNPQPIARAAYERAQGAKALIMFRDQGHGTATDDEHNPERPGSGGEGQRVPLTRGAELESYQQLTWVHDERGYIYLPHQMRNYFITAWFDWQLKGDSSGKAAITDHPFEQGVQSMRTKGLTDDWQKKRSS